MNNNQKETISKLRFQGFGYSKIAKALDISISTVTSHCRRNDLGGVRASKKNENVDLRFCRNCGKELDQAQKQKQRKFCCDKCRVTWWNSHPELVNKKAFYKKICSNCKTEFISYGNRNRKYCSHECYIAERFYKI